MPKQARRLGLALLATAALTPACKKTTSSDVKFITIAQQFSGNVTMVGMLAKVKHKTIKICNVNFTETDQYGTLVSKIVPSWIAPLATFAVDPLASKVEFVASGCDGTVTYDPSVTRAYCDISTIEVGPKVMIGPDQASFPLPQTLAHEFGHAFGLGDTYQNGTSGDCQPGQPDALMCDTKFFEPQEDDNNGILSMYVEENGAASVRKTPGQPTSAGGAASSGTVSGTGASGGTTAGGGASSGPVSCFCAAGADTKGRTVCGIKDANNAWVTPSYFYANGQQCDETFCREKFPKTTANICGDSMSVADTSASLGLTASQLRPSESRSDAPNPVWFANLADACRCGYDATKTECGIFGQADALESADSALALLPKRYPPRLTTPGAMLRLQPLCGFKYCSDQLSFDSALKKKINGRCNLDHMYSGPPGGGFL